jgi:hypothetical protein
MEAKEQAQADAVEARKEEATSTDTLADLEQTQASKPTGTATTNDEADTNSAPPAPDGTPEPERNETADSRRTGEPI